jgi:hypothetical protein
MLNDFNFNVIFAYLVFCEIERYNLVSLAVNQTQQVASDDEMQYIVLPDDLAS